MEAGGDDPDGDGIIGTGPITDIDGDGLHDPVDNTDGSVTNGTPLDNPDTDGDGIPDVTDLDSDNDGIPDVSEVGLSDPDGDGIVGTGGITDIDNDGLDDSIDPLDGYLPGTPANTPAWSNGTPISNPEPDADGDTILNRLDLDSDNDGIPDVMEAGGSDPDGDGIIGTGPIADNDGDGLSDMIDPLDGYDPASGGAGPGTPLVLPNHDNDSLGDCYDIDADNDGIPDNVEAQPTVGYRAPSSTDNDGDGLDDAYDPLDGYLPGASANSPGFNAGTPIPPVNTDGPDILPDYIDPDSDEDGIPDVQENGMTDIPSTTDTDGDGLLDDFEGADTNDGFDVNDEINTPLASILPDGDNDAATGVPLLQDLDYRDNLLPTNKCPVGDFVWFDVNNNQTYDTGEPGLNGVNVNLYRDDAPTDGQPDGAPIDSTITANDPTGAGSNTGQGDPGFYSFQTDCGTNYIVQIDPPELTGGGTLPGYMVTTSTYVALNLSDDTDADIGVHRPISLEVSKTLVGFEPFGISDNFSFNIVITNTGELTIAVLPLEDDYNPSLIEYDTGLGATPSPDSVTPGLLGWNNLAPTGGLPPNQAVSVVVNFRALADTSGLANPQSICDDAGQTCNVATVDGALVDPDGPGPNGPTVPVPTVQGADDVETLAPTAVNLAERQAKRTPKGMALSWITLDEVETVGFNILLSLNDGKPQQLNQQMIVAKRAGEFQGATYSFLDTSTKLRSATSYLYLLEVVTTDGHAERMVFG